MPWSCVMCRHPCIGCSGCCGFERWPELVSANREARWKNLISIRGHEFAISPDDSVVVQRQKFADKGLNQGCLFFRYRLYDFTTTGNADPTINQSFLNQLQALCPSNGDPSKRVALNTDSKTQFDVSYFKNVRDGQGVLEFDQRLWEDGTTQNIVRNYAGNVRGLLGLRFNFEFPKAMVKMSSIGVKTGNQGEIRKICSKFN